MIARDGSRGVIKPPTYSIESGANGHVELVVKIERIDFVVEPIPDGQMAGMQGHREMPSTSTYRFDLYPEQATRLRDEIDAAIRLVTA